MVDKEKGWFGAMLLQFSCENHKSIKDRITFSTIAGKDTAYESDLKSFGNMNVVRMAAIYGANGSGKSNVISAIDFMRALVVNSINHQPGEVCFPGGRLEEGETSLEAAIRETKEETGLTVSDLKERGTLRFQFKDGMRMICYVFTTSVWEGDLKECDEAKPFWADKNNLDYDMMWKDDKLWLPLLLDGKEFEGWFVFDDREMLDAKVECVSEE